MAKRFRKVLKWFFLIAGCLFVLAQFIRPARTNPVADPTLSLEVQMQVDPRVQAILERSCTDCHSNHTRWPWYTNVAPVSWFVIGHVNDGRRDLNLSEWGHYDQRRQKRRLEQMCDLAQAGVMPLGSYTPLHPGSRLTSEDVKSLCDWTKANR